MDLIGLLVAVLIFVLVFWLIWWVIGMIPLPEPFKTVATVVLGIIGVILLLSLLFGSVQIPHLRLH
jgi:heme A synthase